MAADEPVPEIQSVLTAANLADALESEQFRRFLDQIPIAIVVAKFAPDDVERLVYANPEFEKLTNQSAADLDGRTWSVLRGCEHDGKTGRNLGEAVAQETEYVGRFSLGSAEGESRLVDAYSNLIEDEKGVRAFRLAALVTVGAHENFHRDELEARLRDKDVLLRELQHRVKNNLQMITALIRLESRNVQSHTPAERFDRLAGRIASLAYLYRLLSEAPDTGEIDLGVYLSEITSAAMHAHGIEGIRLNMKVDAYSVSVNVAMPAGLLVNELITNALKHAFAGREAGTITLQSLADAKTCRVVVADDGVGLPAGVEWPRRGKLSALIVQSLRENAKAEVVFETKPDEGTRTTMIFTRDAATKS